MKTYITAMFALGIVVGPFITIWSINSLFFTNIEFNITTWLAVFWLQGMLVAAVKR